MGVTFQAECGCVFGTVRKSPCYWTKPYDGVTEDWIRATQTDTFEFPLPCRAPRGHPTADSRRATAER